MKLAKSSLLVFIHKCNCNNKKKSVTIYVDELRRGLYEVIWTCAMRPVERGEGLFNR